MANKGAFLTFHLHFRGDFLAASKMPGIYYKFPNNSALKNVRPVASHVPLNSGL